MPGIKIKGTGICVPEKILTNEELSRTLDTNDEWIVRRTGIRRRHIRSGDEAVHTFAVKAAGKAIEEAAAADPHFSKDGIRAVIMATMSSYYACPSVSCILQKELGLPEETVCFDINAACTGFIYAMQTAQGILAREGGGYALVVGGECMSTLMDYTDRSTCILFGDGAGAAVITFDPSPEAEFLTVAGTRGNIEHLYCKSRSMEDPYLHMNGSEVYRFASGSLNRAIAKLLEKSGKTMDDIDAMVCHQANSRIIESVMKHYPGHESKFFMNMDEYANTSGASVALAMDDMFRQGLLKEGMRVICAAFGAGLSWNGILMTI